MQAEINGHEVNADPETVVDRSHAFVGLLTGAPQLGRRDLEANDMELSSDAIAGASAPYLSNAQIPDGLRHFASQQMGRPTTRLSGGTHISELQRQSYDFRVYNNHLLSGQPGVTTAPPRPRAPPSANSRTTPPPPTTINTSTSTRSGRTRSGSTFAERSTETINRVFRHALDPPEKVRKQLESEFTPNTYKLRKRKVKQDLASDGENVTKMTATSQAVLGTPEAGLSQQIFLRVMQSSDHEDTPSRDDDDDSAQNEKKKKKKRKK